MVEVQVLHSISFDTWGNDSLLQLGAGDEISGSSTRLKLKPFWLDGVAVPHFCYHMASTDTTGVVVEGGFFTVGWWWQSWLPTSPSLTLPQHRVGMALCYCLLGGNLGFPHGFHQYLKEGVPMTTFQKWKFQLPSWPSLMATHGVLGVPCECLMWVKSTPLSLPLLVMWFGCVSPPNLMLKCNPQYWSWGLVGGVQVMGADGVVPSSYWWISSRSMSSCES